jgi:outer membrane protein insertion porin family
VNEQLVRNQLRTAVGDRYDAATVRGDVERLHRLAEFKRVTARFELREDGTVVVIFEMEEEALIAEVQVVGNKLITDQALLSVVQLVRGVPRDDSLIASAKLNIELLYRDRGHYLASVLVDESELEETGILLFRVIEGPRVRVKAIEFLGNESFANKQLQAQIRTRTAVPLFRRGELDDDLLVDDVTAVARFYRDRGYLDVRVDRRIDLSPDSREAKITFLVAEGSQFTLRRVRAEYVDGGPLQVFAPEQIAAMLEIKPGDVYTRDKLRKSIDAVKEAYGLLGYVGEPTAGKPDWTVEVRSEQLRAPEPGKVDLLLRIDEGRRYKVGLVDIKGNFLTKDKVIRREIRGLAPGRPLDARGLQHSVRRIRARRLFSEVRASVEEPDPERPEYRDVLVEVKESNTGSVNFGLALGSDAGVFGEFSLNQRNFDIADFPESFNEYIKGRAFRGAGQRFSIVLRPGNEIFQYLISLMEPSIFETEYSLSLSGSYRQREFDDYDEERVSFRFGVGRKLGDIWNLEFTGRLERVELDDIDLFAPREVFEDAGPNNIGSLGVSLPRTTVSTLTRPGRGSRLELSIDQAGALGGDFDFTTLSANYTVFLTLDEDFLGRKSILKLNSRVGYILNGNDAPIYERFYLGGRTFRGFEFREVSPKGVLLSGLPSDDPVGGEWLFFAGAQYEFPLVEELMTGVVFLDSGTVVDDPGFDDYRASVGLGIRLYIPQLGPVPMAFDFAFPLAKEDDDETQVFSFTAEVPFN